MPDMQTALSEALRKSPLEPKPLNQRIWLWLRDHPWKSPKQIANALKVPREHVQVRLTDMKYRKILQLKPSDLLHARKGEKLWAVAAGMHEFELSPKLPPAFRFGPKSTVLAAPLNGEVTGKSPIAPAAMQHPKAGNSTSTELDKHLSDLEVEKLPLKQARELYDKLKIYFG